IRPLILSEPPSVVRSGIRQMKERIEARLRSRKRLHSEVKLGFGSIRDIEFLVQFLQMVHGKSDARVLSFNTVDALVRLTEFGFLSPAHYRQLRSGYVFLRSVEHSLQLLHNVQTHELPTDAEQLQWLANRLDYPDTATLLGRFDEYRNAVRSIFVQILSDSGDRSEPEAARMESTGTKSVATDQERATGQGDAYDWLPSDLPESAASWFRHLAQRLSVQETALVDCEMSRLSPDCWTLALCGIQFPDWLSTVCGMLAIHQIDIRSGLVMADIDLSSRLPGDRHKRFFGVFEVQPWQMPDKVPRKTGPGSGTTSPRLALPAELKQVLTIELARVCHSVMQGHLEDVRSEVIQRVAQVAAASNERMNRNIPEEDSPGRSLSAQDEIQVVLSDIVESPGQPAETRLLIEGADTLGFLFEVTASLAMSEFRIRRGIVESSDGRVRDELTIVERDGGPVRLESRREEIRLAVTLIKQFTHWLPSVADPVNAIRRFRDLISRLQTSTHWAGNEQALRRPDVMRAVAGAVGISRHLWDDFLAGQQEEMFPILSDTQGLERPISSERLETELLSRLHSASTENEKWTALNQFKDQQLFRVDMRHILGYCQPFGRFAEEITELAEVVVRAAFQLAWADMCQELGEPRCEDHSCQWMIAGLGKFGGIEMGFASDIELLVVFESQGRTAGSPSLANSAFFDRLVNRVATGISARSDGIFHVDLRMCPYGHAGSAAVCVDDLLAYYAPQGPAWPYERQALVKFRPIGPQSDFSARVLQQLQDVLFGGGPFDFASMRAMRERQIRQLVRGGTINAKLSDGCLVDCEYAVQALQLTHGRSNPSLRHPNTLRSLRQAGRLSLISPQMQTEAEAACMFFRELIDCLRMVRGNAHDLTVPGPDSDDFVLLQRRLDAIHGTRLTYAELERQMGVLREFSAAVERLCKSTWTKRPPQV
ncbi:MAG: hypothetical protein KDA96_10860, partial [Planctomycetaceae bacterium]|nr:hypothetical protein [Planctomycetaceae bacterium]